jgi:hypothetical protein
MNQRRWNSYLWAGFLLCFGGFASYPFVFSRFPVTRDFPWANFLLFGAGGAAISIGLKRAFQRSPQYRGKLSGPILAALSVAALSFFCFIIFYRTRLPAPSSALRLGQPAPTFVLLDSNRIPVSLASLLSTPLSTSHAAPKAVVLIFYRGYW